MLATVDPARNRSQFAPAARSISARARRAAALCTVWLAAGIAAASEYTLQEHLGIAWTNEPVAFTLAFPPGAGRELVALTANGVPVHFQAPAEGRVRHADGTLASVRVHVVTDLDPEGTIVFAGRTEGAPSERPPPELRVARPDAGHIEFLTDGFGLRLPVGDQTYDPPVPPGRVPGPIEALRLADGTWFGGSDLYGATPVRAWSTKVIGEGPVFGQVFCRYEYADGNVVEVTVTLNAGAAFAVLRSDSLEDRPEDGFRLVLSSGLPPLTLWVQRLLPPLVFAPEVKTCEWADLPLGGISAETVAQLTEDLQGAVGAGDMRAVPAGTLARLTPWADWFWASTMPVIRLGIDAERELRIERRHAGRWVEPAAPSTMRDWHAWDRKMLNLIRSEEGEVYLDFNHARGERHLQLGEHEPDDAVGWRPRRDRLGRPHGAQVTPEALRLEEVKEMVLDWPEGGERHPRLYMSRGEVESMWQRFREERPPHIERLLDSGRARRPAGLPTPGYHASPRLGAYLASGGNAALAAEMGLAEGLEWLLGLLGDFDRMRSTEELATYYDILIDSGLIEPEARRRLRARMALVAYQLADPATWSIERGYRSFNPNMSVSYTLALGTMACLLRDHPMAHTWMEAPLRMTRHWFENGITPQGEWGESIAHYAHVTSGDFLSFAVAAKNAQFHDFFLEPPLQLLGLYLAQQYTPRDPRHMNRRVTPPVGRGTAGMAWEHFGVLARATRDTLPDYSAVMQWMWRETEYAVGMVKLGGFQGLYADRTLPERQPDWETVRFPNNSVIFRNGVGHPHEHYLNYVAVGHRFGGPHGHEAGGVAAWFAHGQPVSMRFCSGGVLYAYMRRLMNQVTPAFPVAATDDALSAQRMKIVEQAEHEGFARLPLADYAATRYTLGDGERVNVRRLWPGLPAWPPAGTATDNVAWMRQVLFLRGDDPADRHYVVLNDTILNDQPTRWHFWTLSAKLDTAAAAAAAGFLDDAPGDACTPARELSGDRFTARGLYGVDLDFFVAEPVNTPRHTLRYGGGPYRAYAVNLNEYRDLLHLQLPGQGRYCTVIVPRPEGAATPDFVRLDAGRILRVSGAFGTDHLLLADGSIEAGDADSGVRFATAAGAVRERPDGRALILLAPGRVQAGETVLEADGPAELRRRNGVWTLRLDHGEPHERWTLRSWADWGFDRETIDPTDSISVSIRHPDTATWILPEPLPGVTVEREDGRLRLTAPRTVREIVFR